MVEQQTKQPNISTVARFDGFNTNSKVRSLHTVNISEVQRLTSASGEFDRVLGGGLVRGSTVLIGGDPGIGKSTLLLQYSSVISKKLPILYVSGEESVEQLAMCAHRLNINGKNLNVMAENCLETVLETVLKKPPTVLVIDSIQTLYSAALAQAPGSVSQVRECAAQLVRYAKQSSCAVILVGHVTKEGTIAGPRILEHMVDCVLYFEGDANSTFRLIRAFKNRFGAVNEIGVFAMTDHGLKDVENPSAMFIRKYGADCPGSVVLATHEGTRPLLVEVQTLVDESTAANPRRLCVGLEQNRFAMLLAVVHRYAGISLNHYDVFASVVGGLRVLETGTDLALLIAIVSSLKNQPVGNDLVVFGEVGLSGELRPVQRGLERIREAQKLGFKRALIPRANLPQKPLSGIEIIPVQKLKEAVDILA